MLYLYHTYYTYLYIKELCQQVFIYNEEAPCTSDTSCAKVAILLLQDLSTFCVTDIYIYMAYIFTCLFSVRNVINLSRHEHVLSRQMMEEVSLKRVSLISHI